MKTPLKKRIPNKQLASKSEATKNTKGETVTRPAAGSFFLSLKKGKRKKKEKATRTARDKRKRDGRQRAASKQSMGVR